ncbi:HhH-GPD family base excision DNA repair protein [Colletotrichum truncatum]|uniref:HhH-GPD family base excision DNA repair protein n=1 Tax=Colletotrichum truncatum TaxID=5467 RepID=A0ACC3Z0F9_COLTU|nr:HhH-GPD family base excision DNA repair protein [Colletotrichum truncatum]KAF6800664.1 HhH-GPD family base excision DNA repair protein [Colletotrichum truncatum]
MRTRSQAKLAAETALQLEENQGKPMQTGTKRLADTTISLEREKTDGKKRVKREKEQISSQACHGTQDLPHGLGSIHNPVDHGQKHQTPNNNNNKIITARGRQIRGENEPDQGVDVMVKKAKHTPRRTKDNPYGLMPGRTPYPSHNSPTVAQCQEVHDILTQLHGEFRSPGKIPPPSTDIAGCGEVPDLVDAMIRTLISGHTAMINANRAIQDVISIYGQLDRDGIGAGAIDWNKVRLSSKEDIMKSIRSAGLALTKSKEIKEILDRVYEENQIRREAFAKEKQTGEAEDVLGGARLTQGQKDHQISKIENGILTLDHIRCMTPGEAMLEFTKYPGIGIKTASCLVLFCLQQPSFAVDTHVWRMCKWLGWVPRGASRDETYMHCELRVPDHLKYGLHQLFIQHGKTCERCRSITVEGTKEWVNATCPLEHLLDRFDKRKTKAESKTTKIITLKTKRNVKLEASNTSIKGVDAEDTVETTTDGEGVPNQGQITGEEGDKTAKADPDVS